MKVRACIVALMVAASVTSAWAVDVLDTGTLTSVSSQPVCADPGNASSVTFTLSGTFTATVGFQKRIVTTTETATTVLATDTSSGSTATSATAPGTFTIANAGYRQVCAAATAHTSGTVAITITKGFASGGIGGSGGGGGGDGALLDGVSSSIKGSIFDYTNSNPLASVLVDATGAATVPGLIADGATPSIKASVFDLTNSNPLAVRFVDANGSAVTPSVDWTFDQPAGTTAPGVMCAGATAVATPASTDGDATRVGCDLSGALKMLGNLAHGAADSGNPLKIGAKATSSLAGLTLVANNNRTDLFAGLDGALLIRPHANLEDRVSGVVGVTDGSSTTVVAAQGAGVRFCALAAVIANSSATGVTVDLRDGTAGTVLATLPGPANFAGSVVPLPMPLCTTANTAMAVDPSASATTVTTTLIGFKTKL